MAGAGQADEHASRQSPVLSRVRLGRRAGELSKARWPWGTGPYQLVDGISLPDKRSERVVLEANAAYWDTTRLPRLHRIIFDNTLTQHDTVELVKTGEGRVDVVSELSPLETLRVAQSPFAKVVKNRVTVQGECADVPTNEMARIFAGRFPRTFL